MDAQPESLLAADEPPPFAASNLAGRSPFVLLCDHASNRLPRRLGDLGLAAAELERHVAWDIGAAAVARRLSELIDAPLFLAGYSRLAIDLNRPPGSPSSIVALSEATAIPGNSGFSAAEAAARRRHLFDPYHGAIARFLDARRAGPTAIVAVHSFTPVYLGTPRPWHVGFSCRLDARLARPLIERFRADTDTTVGDNQPYPVTLDGDYAIPVHAEARKLPGVLVELRQDLVADAAGQDRWAERLATALLHVLADADIFAPRPNEPQEPAAP